MKPLGIVLLLLLALLPACGQETSKENLPQHTVASNTSLAPKDGRRIEIHVGNVNLTKDECRVLVNAYKKMLALRDKFRCVSRTSAANFNPGVWTTWTARVSFSTTVTLNELTANQ